MTGDAFYMAKYLAQKERAEAAEAEVARLKIQRDHLLIASLETTVALLDAEVIFAHDFAPELRQRLARALAPEETTREWGPDHPSYDEMGQ